MAEGIICTTPMIMENEDNRASETASGMQHITRAGCLGNGQSAEIQRQFPVVIGGASGAIPRTATKRLCRWSTQQQETQSIENCFPSQTWDHENWETTPEHTVEWRNEQVYYVPLLYRVIHKSIRDFQTRLRNNQDRHGRKEHINR